MNKFSLFNEILASVWFIDERSKLAATPFVLQILRGGLSFSDAKERIEQREQKTNILYYCATNQGISDLGNSFDNQDNEGEVIATLGLEGVMTKNDGISSKGTDSLRRDIAAIGQNRKISALRFDVNSGGGSAFSCEGLCQDLAQFEARYNKPLLPYVTGQCCSAAYYAVSNAKNIAISGEATELGSIGTMATLYNDSQLLESEGIKEIIVRATKSSDKNEAYYRALNGDTEMLQKEVLDPLQRGFEKAVKRGRAEKIGQKGYEVLTGKTYYGSDNIKAGLADLKLDNYESLDYLMRQAKKMKRK